jgi:DNA-binding IclR family transcriptional regulator
MVLDALGELNGATLSDLAEYTSLATSTLHTHLHTLERNEYVIQNDGEYQLGLKLFHLGENARLRDGRYRLARKAALELASTVTEGVNFSVEEFGRSIVLFDESSTPHHEKFQAGRYFDMHSSASGKAMLAEYSRERVREIVERSGMPSHTDNTITDIQDLFTELDQIAEQGYAVNRQEEIAGLRSIAMVVTAPDGSVFGTLDISGPPYRLPADDEIAGQLRVAVDDLEASLEAYDP